MKKAIGIMIVGTLVICAFFAGCGKTEDGKVTQDANNTSNSSTNMAESAITKASESLSSAASEVSSDISGAITNLTEDR